MLGVIVLLHCYNWYDWGALRAKLKPVNHYWRDVALTIGVFVFGYFLYASNVVPSLGQLFVESHYYYYYFPFAIAHIATSVRFG
jgi:amino acid permease